MFLDLTTTTLVEWSRWQFAMTAIYHYMFVPDLGVSLDARYHGNHVGKNG